MDNQVEECQKALKKLVGKKVQKIRFEIENDECWRFYITTDQGSFVMTFCRDWTCPVVESHGC